MTTTALQPSPAEAAFAGPILELRGLEKRYTGTHALKPADLAFEAGEIHAIVGENGAGKSTLIKLLTGVTPRSGGEMIWKGTPTDLSSPQEAIVLGINAVHQEVVLCPHLSVAANIFLVEPHDRPAAAYRNGPRCDARHAVPDLRRTHRLPDATGGGAALRADPPLEGEWRDLRLHQPPHGGDL